MSGKDTSGSAPDTAMHQDFRENEWVTWLAEADRAFQQARGQLRANWNQLKMTRPKWMRFRFWDQLRKIYRVQRDIWKHGSLTWGSFIQANSLLFEPGDDQHPLAMMYLVDPEQTYRASEMHDIAYRLFYAKENDVEHESWAMHGAWLANEMSRSAAIPVDPALTHGLRLECGAAMAQRNHLPFGYLSGRFFPVIRAPQISDYALILPSHLWPVEFIQRQWDPEREEPEDWDEDEYFDDED